MSAEHEQSLPVTTATDDDMTYESKMDPNAVAVVHPAALVHANAHAPTNNLTISPQFRGFYNHTAVAVRTPR
jgi:hypothetical protein